MATFAMRYSAEAGRYTAQTDSGNKLKGVLTSAVARTCARYLNRGKVIIGRRASGERMAAASRRADDSWANMLSRSSTVPPGSRVSHDFILSFVRANTLLSKDARRSSYDESTLGRHARGSAGPSEVYTQTSEFVTAEHATADVMIIDSHSW